MSPKSFRRTAAALLLASFTAIVPGHAFELGRRSLDRPTRTTPVSGVFALLRELLDLLTGQTLSGQTKAGGGMDPNGTPTVTPSVPPDGPK